MKTTNKQPTVRLSPVHDEASSLTRDVTHTVRFAYLGVNRRQLKMSMLRDRTLRSRHPAVTVGAAELEDA